jgi:DNA polymerase-3 subunit alpha (Gram-positive type)
MRVTPEGARAVFGETLPYVITIRNTGTENAVLSIGAEDDLGWQLSLSTESLFIAAGEQVQLRLDVALPVSDDFVVLDLETTGLNPAEHEIIEIAWVRFERDQIVQTFSSLVRPQRPLPADITELTGISPDDVASAPPMEEALPGVLAALSGRTVVAHNASFDRGFLEVAVRRTGLAVPDVSWVDTLETARQAWPGLANYSLSSLRHWLGLSVVQEHRALPDAEAAGRVWLLALDTSDIVLTNTITLHAFGEGTVSPCATVAAVAEASE